MKRYEKLLRGSQAVWKAFEELYAAFEGG